MTTNLETRVQKASGLEVRAKEDGLQVIRGLGIVYNKLSQDFGGWVERIDPRATNKTLGDGAAGVYATFNHDDNQILGRVRAGTLRLEDSKDGLIYEVDPDAASPVHQHVLASVKRGDVDGSSFTFMVMPNGAEFEELEDGRICRVITELRLYEIGPVVNPAYLDTTSQARSILAPLAKRSGVDLEEVVRCAQEGHLRDIVRAADTPAEVGTVTSKTEEPGDHSEDEAAKARLYRARVLLAGRKTF